jgi:hypothetical protein
MRMIGVVMMTGALLTWSGRSDAVDIQYLIETGDVTAASDTPIPTVPSHGVVTLIGTVSQLVWPVPSGCPTGRLEWSRITNPDTVTLAGGGMAVRPGLLFFQTTSPLLTGCHLVSSWRDLKRVMNQALLTGMPDGDIVGALNVYNGWYYARCDDAPTNQNCLDWKAQLNTLNQAYPSRVQGIQRTTEAATLVNDAFAFKAAQCAAQPGGPFC